MLNDASLLVTLVVNSQKAPVPLEFLEGAFQAACGVFCALPDRSLTGAVVDTQRYRTAFCKHL